MMWYTKPEPEQADDDIMVDSYTFYFKDGSELHVAEPHDFIMAADGTIVIRTESDTSFAFNQEAISHYEENYYDEFGDLTTETVYLD